MAPMEGELRAGLAELGLLLSDAQVGQLLQFAGLLQKWTQVYNLTALRRPEEILTHHVLDCAAVLEPLSRWAGRVPRRILDVGSGGGLPGVVIAIACPEITVDCVDAVAKKVAFVQQAASALRLPNLRGLHGRVEQLQDSYDLVTSRAFATLADFASLSKAALVPSGVWMAMKAKFPAHEVAALPPDVEMFHVEQLQIPGLTAERCLVWLRRRSA
jgi:16S rRNA (guanine527-N7)-methyltransferase